MTQQAPPISVPDPSPHASSAAPEATPHNSRRSLLARLRREDSGQDLIEYALTAAMIGLTAVSGMVGLAGNIADSFNSIGSAVTSAVPAGSTGSNNSGGGNNNGGGGHHGHGHGGGFGGFGGFHHHH